LKKNQKTNFTRQGKTRDRAENQQTRKILSEQQKSINLAEDNAKIQKIYIS